MDNVVRASADIALLMDEGGVIREVYFGEAFAQEPVEHWVGKRWDETVTGETRPKVAELLGEASRAGVSRARQLNQSLPSGTEVPVNYTAVRVGTGGKVLAVGRDLQILSTLQRRLVEAQQAMERDYWRLRQIETRHRLLFQLSAEAVLVVDAASGRVVEANPAAADAWGIPIVDLVGRSFPDDFAVDRSEALRRHLADVRAQGRAEEVRLRLRDLEGEWLVRASVVHQDPGSFFLVRLRPAEGAAPSAAAPSLRALAGIDLVALLDRLPDGFAVVDSGGEVLRANRAFLDLVQLSTEEEARRQAIDRWIGRPGADWSVLLALLRAHGVVRLFTTVLHGELGLDSDVEISAVSAPEADVPCIALVVRDVGRRLASGPEGAANLSRAVEQLTGLVGRVSLKDLVQDTVGLVERHFIEAALELTGDNRTAASEVLGVSRQSLYTKLKRYNLEAGGASGASGAGGDAS